MNPTILSLENREAFLLIYARCRPGGFVAIGSNRQTAKGNPAPHYEYILPVDEIERHWTTLQGLEGIDTRFMIPNTLNKSALGFRAPEQYNNAFHAQQPLYYKAKDIHIHELANIVVDLDVGRKPSQPDAKTAAKTLMQMCLEESVPWPNLLAYSGRGLYVIYRLIDSDGYPPTASEGAIHQWKKLGKRLRRQLKHLESDANAGSLSNWYKIPGTVDGKTGKTVVYNAVYNSKGSVPDAYTLNELSRELGLGFESQSVKRVQGANPSAKKESKRLVRSDPASQSVNVGEIEKNKHIGPGNPDPAAPHRKRVQEILLLNDARGGMPEGCRHMTVRHHYFSVRACERIRLNKIGESDAAAVACDIALKLTRDLNATFRPPLSDREIKDATRSFGKGKRYQPQNSTVAGDLKVTEDEITELDLCMLVESKLTAIKQQSIRNDDVLVMARKRATPQEIAKILGLTPGAVRHHIRRYKKKGYL
jgi:hypothetical protein